MNNTFRFVDLFCGGGGGVTGAIHALRDDEHWCEVAAKRLSQGVLPLWESEGK